MKTHHPAVEEVYARITAAVRAVENLPYDDEPVDQLQHALQCAHLAREKGRDPEVIVAALLHDIGRSPVVLWEMGKPSGEHGRLAGEWLAPLVGRRVAWLAEQHVPAKRYLVATDPEYRGALTPTSVRTLQKQGGPMSREEAGRFEQHPDWREVVELRRWDDLGKKPDAGVPPLESYEGVLKAVIEAHLSRQKTTEVPGRGAE